MRTWLNGSYSQAPQFLKKIPEMHPMHSIYKSPSSFVEKSVEMEEKIEPPLKRRIQLPPGHGHRKKTRP